MERCDSETGQSVNGGVGNLSVDVATGNSVFFLSKTQHRVVRQERIKLDAHLR